MSVLTYNLNLHLAYLLFQEDSVSVHNLGTFSVRRYGSEIQLPAGLVLPPARRVSFSPQASETSPSLLKHLGSIEGMNPTEAESAIAHATAEYRRVLDQGDRLVLQGIGSLRHVENQWTFKASLEANFLSSSFGLPMFRMDLIDAHVPSSPDAPAAPRIRSWQAAAVVAGALGLAAIGGSKDNVRLSVQQATLNWNVSEWVSSNMADLQRSWDSWRTYDEPISSNATPTAPAQERTVESAVNEPSTPDPGKTEDAVIPVADERAVLTTKPTVEPAAIKSTRSSRSTSENSYALIVGAFAEKANAHRLAASLNDSGYPAEVLEANVGLTKVALRTFASEDAARQAKAKLKVDFPAIWIYHQ